MPKKFGLQCSRRRDNTNVCWVYYLNNVVHRDDGPAYIHDCGRYNGSKFRWKNGLMHREDGPAHIEIKLGGEPKHRWYLDHEEYTKENFDVEIQRRQQNNNEKVRITMSQNSRRE